MNNTDTIDHLAEARTLLQRFADLANKFANLEAEGEPIDLSELYHLRDLAYWVRRGETVFSAELFEREEQESQ